MKISHAVKQVGGFLAFLFIAVAMFGLGAFAGQDSVRQQQVTQDIRESRILDWIVERNPQATIKDFSGFPRTLLQESEKSGIDYRIVLALIDKESQFHPGAIGQSGEIGLMQVMPATAEIVAKNLGIRFEPPVKNHTGRYTSLGTLGNPKQNVRIGVSFLRDQVEKFGAGPTALRAYNRGDTNAKQQRPGDRYAEDIGLRLVSLVQKFPR